MRDLFQIKGKIEQLQTHSFLLSASQEYGFLWSALPEEVITGSQSQGFVNSGWFSLPRTGAETSAEIQRNWRLGKVWASYPLCAQVTWRFQDGAFLLLDTQIHEISSELLDQDGQWLRDRQCTLCSHHHLTFASLRQ